MSRIAGAISGAGQGFVGGAATGVPHAAGIGAVAGAIGGFFGGGSGKKPKDPNKKARKKTYKYNKEVWRYNWKEARDQYEYAVDGLNIRKQNDKALREYQEQINENNYNHAMAIRDYEFNQANRVYERSVADAAEQKSFNQMASEFALKQQDRYKEESLRGMMFDQKQTLADYAANTAGIRNQKRKLRNQRFSARAESTFATQASRLEGLKAAGSAAATGPGRSNAKRIQAAMAESGANQAAIAEQLMFGLTDINLSMDKLNIQAEAMSNQLILDNARLAASVSNLNYQDTLARENIEFQLLDANRRADASIHLKPEMTPPMPKPVALPTPEYQDIYEPKRPPKPEKGANIQIGATPSFAQSVVPAAMGAIQSFANAGMFSGGGGYAENTSPLSMFQNAPANTYSTGLASNLSSTNLFSSGSNLMSGFTSPVPGTGGGGILGAPATTGLTFSSSIA